MSVSKYKANLLYVSVGFVNVDPSIIVLPVAGSMGTTRLRFEPGIAIRQSGERRSVTESPELLTGVGKGDVFPISSDLGLSLQVHFMDGGTGFPGKLNRSGFFVKHFERVFGRSDGGSIRFVFFLVGVVQAATPDEFLEPFLVRQSGLVVRLVESYDQSPAWRATHLLLGD